MRFADAGSWRPLCAAALAALTGCASSRLPEPAVDPRGTPITAREIRAEMSGTWQTGFGILGGLAGAVAGSLAGGLLGSQVGCIGANEYDDMCRPTGAFIGAAVGAGVGVFFGRRWGASLGFDKDRQEAIEIIGRRRLASQPSGLDSALTAWLGGLPSAQGLVGRISSSETITLSGSATASRMARATSPGRIIRSGLIANGGTVFSKSGVSTEPGQIAITLTP